MPLTSNHPTLPLRLPFQQEGFPCPNLLPPNQKENPNERFGVLSQFSTMGKRKKQSTKWFEEKGE